MGTDATVSLSLIFSIISMLGVIANIFVSFKRESDSSKAKEIQIEKHFAQIDVRLDNILTSITEIANNYGKTSQKIDDNIKAILQSNERIGTLFRLHDDNERRIETLEKRLNNNE